MMETRLTRYGLRVAIVVFWVITILGIFYIPHVAQLFQEDRSISIVCWPAVIDPQIVEEFERETGIKVYFNYFDSNEELLAKLQISKGQGYDLITPSDFMVAKLQEEGLLQKIDKTKLNFLPSLDPHLMGHYFDKENEYSIPLLWAILGVGINVEMFKTMPEPSWNLIFEGKKFGYTVGMSNHARYGVLIAAQYLFGSIDTITAEKLKEIEKLLLRQKASVEAYTDLRADFLLQLKTCPAVVVASSELWRSMRFNKTIDFLIPKEGGFLVIDSFALSAASKKQDFVYKFLNFIYQLRIAAYQADKYSYFPAVELPKELQLSHGARRDIALLMKEQFNKLDLLRPVLSESVINNIWLSVKSY